MDASKTAALRPLRILLITLTLYSALLWQPVAAQDAGLSEAGLAIANAINQVRVENGLEPVAVHPLLNQAAQGHVDDMLTNYIYGHYGSDGSSVHMRVARTGYSDKPWVSENWVSSGSPAGAMRWWMNDYIHRVNILTPRWREVGIGVGTRGSEMIFVTVFSAGEGAEGQAVSLEVPVEAPSVRIEQQNVPAEGLDYTVRPGDTLLAIGLRYGMPWEDVAAANGLNETSLLQIGQVLRIPGSGEAAAAAVAPVPDVPTQPYIVQSGETLFSIANKRGLTWQELAALNQMGEHSVLQINQEIKVPADEPIEEPVVEPAVAARAEGDGAAAKQAATPAAKEAGAEADPALDERAAALAAIPVTAPGEAAAPSPIDAAPAALASSPAESAPVENAAPSGAVANASVANATVANGAVASGAAADNSAVAQATSVSEGPSGTVETAPVEAAPAPEVALASVAAVPASAAAANGSAGVGGSVVDGPGVDSSAAGDALYRIAEGDTLFSVAVAQGLDWQQLMALNNLNENSILQPGQLIRLR